MDSPRRLPWDGHPVSLGKAFTLEMRKADRNLYAVCELWSHPLGWELTLTVDDEFARSHVCRSSEGVLSVTEEWRAALTAKGWN
jgi:hypothetical protein